MPAVDVNSRAIEYGNFPARNFAEIERESFNTELCTHTCAINCFWTQSDSDHDRVTIFFPCRVFHVNGILWWFQSCFLQVFPFFPVWLEVLGAPLQSVLTLIRYSGWHRGHNDGPFPLSLWVSFAWRHTQGPLSSPISVLISADMILIFNILHAGPGVSRLMLALVAFYSSLALFFAHSFPVRHAPLDMVKILASTGFGAFLFFKAPMSVEKVGMCECAGVEMELSILRSTSIHLRA